MIQLTKGTNVLDINLSDYSGAGQDVVQNGSFDDIGSDLVTNGDFAKIGSELVTNGDFSAVPLTGGELATFSLGNITLVNLDGSISTSLGGIDYRSVAIGDTVDSRPRVQFDNLTEGKSYKVVYTPSSTSGTSDFDLFQNGVRIVLNHDISLPLTFSLLAGASYNGIDFNGTNTFTTDYTLSIIEEINLVTNPNFTDTGAEEAIALTSWTAYTSGTSTVTYDGSTAELNIDASNSNVGIYQTNIFALGKSYKIVLSMKATASFDAEIVESNGAATVATIGTVSLTTSYQDFTFYYVGTGTYDLFIHRLFSASGASQTIYIETVSVKELGEDWIPQPIDPDSASFDENGLTIVQSSDLGDNSRVYQLNVTEADKSYKVTYIIHSVSLTSGNSVQYYDGDSYEDLPEQSEGTHTFYYTREGANNNWIFNLRAPTDAPTDFVTISSIVVQELGEDWTVIENGGGSVTFGGSFAEIIKTSSTPTFLQQDYAVTLGASHKLTYTVTENTLPSSADELALSSGSAYGYSELDASASATPKTVYLTVTDETPTAALRLFSRGNSGSIKITNISVKEVGQDWTFGGGWNMGDDEAVADGSISVLNLLTQDSGLVADNSYKISFNSDRIGGILFVRDSDNNTIYTLDDGIGLSTNTFYTKWIGSGGTIKMYAYSYEGSITDVIVQQLDTNNRWVTFADPDSKSVMKQGQVDLEIDSSGNNCGVYQTGLIKPNKLYIITINMKATAAINVEIAASLGTAVSAVIGTETLTTSYKEYSFEYVTPFAVDHDLQIHRLFGSGASQTISIDYVSMNGVDESKWTNDPTWDPFATSLVFVPTLTDESTNNSKQFTLDTSISDGGWDGRSLHGQVSINEFPTEVPASGIINLKQPDFLEGFYQVEIRGYLGTFYRVLGKCMAHLERASTEDGYNRFESYNDTVTYKAYEE